ncbi:MAG: hypothetical protein FK733_13020 [Asgard group archaeon]|nr:hypothetical protein [Asgard group archaeon]
MKNNNQVKISIILALTVLFVSTPLANGYYARVKLTEIGSIETNGEAMIVAVKDNIAFVLDTADLDPGGLMIINISDPTSPELLSSLYDGGTAMEIAVGDDIVYIADGQDGIEIINVTDLENPVEIYQYPVSTFSSDVELVGDLLYTANWDYGLEIFNVSNPYSPVKIVQYVTSINCVHVDVQDDIACVTDHRNDYTSIKMLNVSNPSSIQLLDTHAPPSTDYWDPMIYGDFIYVGNHAPSGGGLHVFNMSNPSSIHEVTEFNSGGSIFTVNFNDSLAFVADYDKGVIVLDITDPSNPIDIGSFRDGGNAKEVVVKDNLLFVADRSDGLEILQAEITTGDVPGFGIMSGLIAISIVTVLYWMRKKVRSS